MRLKKRRFLMIGNTYETSFDAMGRPSRVAYQQPAAEGGATIEVARNAVYDAAGRLVSLERPSALNVVDRWMGKILYGATLAAETRQYNVRGQMTRQSFNGIDIQYIFPSVNNDGRVERRVFTGPGVSEDVSYTYDVLGRLTRAETAGAEWGQGFVYDGFGNLTQKNVVKGSALAMSLVVNGATNRVAGWTYDANGNVTQSPQGWYSYDAANRLVWAQSAAGTEAYGYAGNNQRVWKKRDGTMEVYFYLPDGRLVATYERIWRWAPDFPNEWCLKRVGERVWFAGTLLTVDGERVYTDRLGSVVRRGTQVYRYYPHGEPFGTNPVTTGPHFATYERDQVAGLDQAWNRGYLPTYGRFAQADPYQASGGAGDPGSWNRYGYVVGDPVNYRDPTGLIRLTVEYCNAYPGDPDCRLHPKGDGWLDCYQHRYWDPEIRGRCLMMEYLAYLAPPPREERPRPQEPICAIELWYRPTQMRAMNHAYLRLLIEFEGESTEVIVEAGPERDTVGDWGLLIRRNYPEVSVPGGAGNRQWGSSLKERTYCADAARIQNAVGTYENNLVPYRPIAGPNRNSFINWVMQTARISHFWGSAPPDTWAWSIPLYP
jgi:RHS repeat-associated protein